MSLNDFYYSELRIIMPIVRYHLLERSEDFKTRCILARFTAAYAMADAKDVMSIKFPFEETEEAKRLESEDMAKRWEIHKAWVKKTEAEERQRLEWLSTQNNLSDFDKKQVAEYLKWKNGKK